MFNIPITRRQFFFADPYFAANWPDYERLRGAMIGDEKSGWKRLEAIFCHQSHCMLGNLIEEELKQ
jgi:hypothetical protein